jgi:hypothetical protein
MRDLLLSLLIFYTLAAFSQQTQPPSASPPHRVNSKQNSNNNKNQADCAPNLMPNYSPVIVEITDTAQKNQEGRGESNYWHKVISPEIIPNWILAAFAIVAAIIALLTLRAIKREEKGVKTIGEAARLNAQAVINAERAWIQVELGAPDFRLQTLTGNNGVGVLNWSITNTGRTPARLVEIAARYSLIRSLNRIPEEPKYEGDLEKIPLYGKLLAPKESFWSFQELEPSHITQDDLTTITRGERTLFVYGYVIYLDVFDAHHELGFCYYYSVPQGGIPFVKEGWRPYLQAPAEYNKAT